MARLRVQCPQCHTDLYVERDKAGEIVTCSDCLEEFVAEVAPAVSTEVPAAPDRGPDQQPPATAHEEDRLLDGVGDPPEPAVTPTVPESPPEDDEEDFEFDVECPLCGTRLGATRARIGGKIRCPDCYTRFTVRSPSKRRRRKRRAEPSSDDGEFRLEEPVADTLFHEQAQGLIASAEAEIRDPDALSRPHTDKREAPDEIQKAIAEQRESAPRQLPRHPLTTSIAVILTDPAAVMRGLGFAFALQLEVWAWNTAQRLFAIPDGPAQFMACMLFAFLFLFGVPVFANWSMSMLAILQDTAGGNDEVESWPDLNFLDWILDAIYLPAALFVAVLPGLAVGQLARITTGEIGLPIAAAASVFLLFPFVLVSMLEAGSPIGIISSPVARSLHVATRRWLQFYGLTAVLISAALAAWQLRWFESVLLNFLAAAAAVAAGLLYFRLLGRLAWCCQEAVAKAENQRESQDEAAET
jgi:DNA-directed RNA polymerase subunit M/transcription elongation factor TFIIS